MLRGATRTPWVLILPPRPLDGHSSYQSSTKQQFSLLHAPAPHTLSLSPPLSSFQSEGLGGAQAVQIIHVGLLEARRKDHRVLNSPLGDT